MSDYKGGYGSEAPRYIRIPIERKEYEKYVENRDLLDFAGRIERGEPHEVNPNYGGQGYTYLYPETKDLGRLKAPPVEDTWKFEWENTFNG